MKEICKTNDLVNLSFIQSLLEGEGIEAVVLDEHSGTFFSGMMGISRRLVVDDDDFDRAIALIKDSDIDLNSL